MAGSSAPAIFEEARRDDVRQRIFETRVATAPPRTPAQGTRRPARTTVKFWVPGIAPRAPEPSEPDDDDVAVEREPPGGASVPASVGVPTIET